MSSASAPIASTGPLTAPRYRWIDQCPLCECGKFEVIRIEENVFGVNDPAYVKMYDKPPVGLRRCDRCGFAWTERIPDDPEYYRQVYSYGYDYEFEYRYNIKETALRQARRHILRYVSDGRLLDVGASNGFLMKYFSDHFKPQGVEVSVAPAEFAQKKGWDVQIGLYQDIDFPPATFNVIMMVDVLEHLPHPGAILEKNFRLLKPDGVLYIKVPNYTAQIAKQDFLKKLGVTKDGIMPNFCHINHFTPKSLGDHLKKIGFEVLVTGYTPVAEGFIPDGSPMLRRVKNAARNLVRNSVTWMCNTLASLTGSPLGFNFYILVRKPVR